MGWEEFEVSAEEIGAGQIDKEFFIAYEGIDSENVQCIVEDMRGGVLGLAGFARFGA